jgi:hypothetical protein
MTRYLRLAIAWALLIAFLCLTPGKALPQWEWADLLSVDKVEMSAPGEAADLLTADQYKALVGA